MVNSAAPFEPQSMEVPFDEGLGPTVVTRSAVAQRTAFIGEPDIRTGVAATTTAVAALVGSLANERLVGHSQRRVSLTTHGVSTSGGRNARQQISIGDGICCGWVNFFSGEAVLKSHAEVASRVQASPRRVELAPAEYGLITDALEHALLEHRIQVRRNTEPGIYEYAPASSSAIVLALTVTIAALVGALTVWLLARVFS